MFYSISLLIKGRIRGGSIEEELTLLKRYDDGVKFLFFYLY